MTRTFWLSFCDDDRPPGQQFLGVAVVDVTLDDDPDPDDKPWIAAALRKAWATGCNPGGNVASMEITGSPDSEAAPRNRLMQMNELRNLGLIARTH